MNQRRGNYSTPESIAQIIFTAATDGPGRILYLAGSDAEQAFALHRSMSEAERSEMVRQYSGL